MGLCESRYNSDNPLYPRYAKTAPEMPFPVEKFAERAVIVKVGDSLDFRSAPGFKFMMHKQIEDGARHFVLDFSETRTLDSTGLGSVFLLYRRLSPLDGQVVFAAATKPVAAAVQMTHVSSVFQQFASVGDARAAISEIVEAIASA